MPADVQGPERSGEATIHRDRLADQAYEVLRQRILSRSLRPGDRLSVPPLAQDLGLSRSPVREAVQRLVADGLLTERPRQGAVVASVDPMQLGHLYQVRAALEGLSASLAAAAADSGLVAALRECIAQQTAAFAAGDEPSIIRADRDFHNHLLRAAANPELNRALTPILGRVAVAMLAGDLGSWPALAIREHEAILEAVAAGDGERARQCTEGHVLQVRDRLMRKLSAGSSPVAERESAGTDPR